MLGNDATSIWRSRRYLLLSTIVITSLLTLYFTRNHAQAVFSSSLNQLHRASDLTTDLSSDFPSIRNSTLGFQEVYILNLAERSDKLDTFLLTSSLTDFTFSVIPGVDGATVPNKSLSSLNGLPSKQASRDRSVGSWRAHLNFAQTIVRNRVSTALLFEDDADWDISFKSQLELFAAGSRALSSKTPTDTPHSPYGDDWDLLWLGHCGIRRQDNDSQTFVIENDPAVPPPNHRATFGEKGQPNMTSYGNSTRIVFRAGGGLCVYAYALSFRGAQKMLLRQNTREGYAPFDLSLNNMCRNDPDFQCLAVFPQIIDSHKAAGPENRDSDLGDMSQVKGVRKKGYTFNIVRSVRLNLKQLIMGKSEDQLELQWGDQPEVKGPITTRWEG